VEALRQIDAWEVEFVAAGVTRADGVVAARGETDRPVPLASVTKPITALALLVATEEGIVDLADPAGPPGSTVRHLLAHASGLPFEGTEPIGSPGRRRIYSNEGFGLLGELLAERAEMAFAEYVRGAVVDPLGLDLDPDGHPAWGMRASLADLLALARELLAPTLVAAETHAELVSVQFPGLDGVLPGFGRFSPLDWGLGVEIRGAKQPHWTGTRNSPATFGHFGRSGTFLWVDPVAGAACACVTTELFGDWREAWPRLSDAVLAEL
jgi:CubicO group peptidase (beta-lactamase class C family)